MKANTKNTSTASKQPSRIMLGTHPHIANADKLYQRLCKCAARKTDVNLYADKVESVDTIALQLLLSFVRQVRDNGNQVNWKSPSDALLKTAAVTGLQAELLLDDATG